MNDEKERYREVEAGQQHPDALVTVTAPFNTGEYPPGKVVKAGELAPHIVVHVLTSEEKTEYFATLRKGGRT